MHRWIFVLVIACNSASAVMVRYDFEGVATESRGFYSGCFEGTAGNRVAGSFGYDTDYFSQRYSGPMESGDPGQVTRFNVSPSDTNFITFQVEGCDQIVAGNLTDSSWVDNFGNVPNDGTQPDYLSDTFSLIENSDLGTQIAIVFQERYFPDTPGGEIRIPDALTNTDPLSFLDLSDWTTAWGQVASAEDEIAFYITSITSAVSVPEPGSLALLVSGLCALVVVRSRAARCTGGP